MDENACNICNSLAQLSELEALYAVDTILNIVISIVIIVIIKAIWLSVSQHFKTYNAIYESNFMIVSIKAYLKFTFCVTYVP